MKVLLYLLLCCGLTYSQVPLSEPSKFLESAKSIQINYDEQFKVSFRSGLDETVDFIPCQLINLETNAMITGLQIESQVFVSEPGISKHTVVTTAWIGLDEIDGMLEWFDRYVVPTSTQKTAPKTAVKYRYKCKELTFEFERTFRAITFSIRLTSTKYPTGYFWTINQVQLIPKVLERLRYLKNKP